MAACAAHRRRRSGVRGSVSAKMRRLRDGGEARCLRAGCLIGAGEFSPGVGKSRLFASGHRGRPRRSKTNDGPRVFQPGYAEMQDRGLGSCRRCSGDSGRRKRIENGGAHSWELNKPQHWCQLEAGARVHGAAPQERGVDGAPRSATTAGERRSGVTSGALQLRVHRRISSSTRQGPGRLQPIKTELVHRLHTASLQSHSSMLPFARTGRTDYEEFLATDDDSRPGGACQASKFPRRRPRPAG